MSFLTETRAIQVGDLVQVVRSCCAERVKPTVFQVAAILPCKTDRFYCNWCNSAMPLEPYGWAGTNDASIQPISRLKRIPPLAELEGTKTDEPIQEPA